MSATKKRKKKKVEKIEKDWYYVEVDDWEVYYHFDIALRNSEEGAYREGSNLYLLGKILSPPLKNASRANIRIAADPTQDDYWSREPTILSAKAIGFMEIARCEETLYCRCSVPNRLSHNIHVATASGEIKHISICGTKLKWRRGVITSISLSTKAEDWE